MRENKFKGISIKTGEFVYGGLVRANDSGVNCWAIKDTMYNINNGKLNIIPTVVIPETVGQFTESTAHDAKEIYEGDKVIAEYDEPGSEIPNNFEGVVQFIESGFYVTNNELQLIFPVFQEIAQWKVTGNIHKT